MPDLKDHLETFKVTVGDVVNWPECRTQDSADYGLASLVILKILVSTVRFRPWPSSNRLESKGFNSLHFSPSFISLARFSTSFLLSLACGVSLRRHHFSVRCAPVRFVQPVELERRLPGKAFAALPARIVLASL